MCINRGQKPESDLAHARDDANPHILRMVEGTFSLDATHFIIHIIMQIYTCDPTLYLFSKASMRKIYKSQNRIQSVYVFGIQCW